MMNNIEKALEIDEARNNDLELILSVWELDGVHLPTETRKAILELATHPETITRTRRTLQANGKYLANKHVRKFREDKAIEARDTLGESISETPTLNPSVPQGNCQTCTSMRKFDNWKSHIHVEVRV